MIPLRLHSDFSLLKAMVPVEKYCETLKALGYAGAALTDFENAFGWIDFYFQMKKAGLKPLLGTTLKISLTSELQFSPAVKQKGEITFIVQNARGYENLCLLLSAYSLQSLTLQRLLDLQEGLIAMVSPDHPHLSQGDSFFSRWQRDRLFFQMFRYEGAPDLELAIAASQRFGRCVATQPVYYLKPEDHLAHEVLMGIGESTTLDDENRPQLPSHDFYLKSADDMRALFRDHPEWIEATEDIVKTINFDLKSDTYHIPKFLPDDHTGPSVDELLYQKCQEGLKTRLDLVRSQNPPEEFERLEAVYRARLEEEYGIICKMRFSDYFLVVSDFIQWSKSQGIPVGPGRGSGAGSLAAYCLSIVDIDPVKYNLLFERFLNPERVSMPDFDVDFCIKGRERVIDYVRQKYNIPSSDLQPKPIEESLRVAQIITFGKMKSKAVIRDVGRVLAIPYSDVDAVAKLVPNVLNITLKEAFEMNEEFDNVRARDPKVDRLLTIAEQLEGLNRHSSVHAAGVVIADDILTKYIPLYRGSDHEIVSQFEMKGVEKLGLLKFDFLGLRNLTVIQEAIDRTKESIDLLTIDYSDAKVMHDLAVKDTVGIFQLESSGMRDVIRRLKPNRFEDIIAIVALYRPGPLEGGMVDDFILRKAGKREVVYDSPVLEPILKETYGVFVYQEQVMKTANVMAGFSLGEADLLRRAMGKKIASEMAQQREKFVSGAVALGHPESLAQSIFDLMSEFAKYGFNKSHAAAYAMVTVQTAYLKVYYPEAFYAALLSSEAEDVEKIGIIIRAALKEGIQCLPPHINYSYGDFAIEGSKAVRFGLASIKNMGQAVAEAIVKTRQDKGVFASVEDFFKRMPSELLNKRSAESLIRSGSLDGLGQTRSTLFASLDSLLGLTLSTSKSPGQGILFSAKVKYKLAEEWPDRIRFSDEKSLLGTYVTGHPLKSYAPLLQSFRVRDIEDVLSKPAPPKEVEVPVAGLVVSSKEIITKKGTRMAFFSLEDLTGTIEVVVFSDLFQKKGGLVAGDRLLFVKGQVVKENEVTRILARDLEELSTGQFQEVVLQLRSPDDVAHLESFQKQARAFSGPIKVKVAVPVFGEVEGMPLQNSRVTLDTELSIRMQPEFLRWIENQFGNDVLKFQ